MKRCIRSAGIMVIIFLATTAFSQEWTKPQKDIWQVVEDSWTKWKAGDLDGANAYLSDKYQGWSDNDALPTSKEMMLSWAQEAKNTIKLNRFSLNPARIVVTDNAAVVDYYYWCEMTITTDDKKEKKEMSGKNAEFYVRENGKWLLLGDLTVHDKK
jgi:hypothetical protein